MEEIQKCKNCGHQIWIKYGYGYVHRHSNVVICSGDEKEITNCPCTNPQPIQEVKPNSSN